MTPSPTAILTARQKLMLTQKDAASVVGASARAWADWERGRRSMPAAKWELFNLKLPLGMD